MILFCLYFVGRGGSRIVGVGYGTCFVVNFRTFPGLFRHSKVVCTASGGGALLHEANHASTGCLFCGE